MATFMLSLTTWEQSLKASGDLSSTFVGENLHQQDGSVNEESPD
jgi:hypothetical protein